VTTESKVPAEAAVGLEGLTRSTVYHYRLCAEDSQQQGGPGCGEDRHFKTQSFACGETVTADVRLTGNVGCDFASIPGIRVGADGVEIDLNGHSLIGPVFVGGGDAPAIDDSGGFDDLIVRDGSIGNFGDGIEVAASSTRLTGNRADDNGDFGIDAVTGVADGGGNTASGNGAGQCSNVFCP
jgi:hypothetical protein